MVNSSRIQFFLICFVSVAALPVIILSSNIVVNTVFTFIVGIFLPGYSLLLALYPRRGSLDNTERFLLSFALPLAVVPLILLVLNYVWSLELLPNIISITIFTLAMATVGWWRQRRLPLEDRFALSISKGSGFKFSSKLANYRFILWLVLLTLSTLILLFPVNITLDPSPIQSVNIFANLPMFIVLFLFWMGILLYLLFSGKEQGESNWEKLALICIFAMVFVNFWTVKTPYGVGGDSLSNFGVVKYLQQESRITSPIFRYLDFPGVFLFTYYFSQFANLSVLTTGYIIEITTVVLFCALIYRFFVNLLKSNYAAFLALLIAVILGQLIRTEFRPDTLGYILLAGFLVLLTKERHTPLRKSSDILLTIILLGAVTITYLMHAALFFFILLGVYFVQALGRKEKVDVLLLILPLVSIMSWELYGATQQFNNTVAFLPSLVERLKSLDFLFTFEQQQTASLATAVPLWAVVTRYFRLGVFYILGTIIGFITLARFNKLNLEEKIAAGGFLGVGLISVILLFLWPKGHQYNRYLWYTPMFLAPIIVMFISRLRWKKYVTIVLASILFVVSLPIFLTNGSGISAAYVSQEDCAAGEFLNERYGEGDGITIYSNYYYGGDIAWYYLLKATYTGTREYSYLKDADALLNDVQQLVEEFQNLKDNSVFVYSERRALGWYDIFGIKPDDPRWQNIKLKLSGDNEENLIFTNEYIHIYKPPETDVLPIESIDE